jgi:glutamate 5-kinase
MKENYKKVLIKVGSNLIVDNNGIRKVFLNNLVNQIIDIYRNGIKVILVTSGAIGSGIKRLQIKKKNFSLSEKQAIAAVGQIVLMQEYKNLFKNHNIPVAQILLTHEDVKDKIRNANVRNTINTLLSWGVIPIINENDTVATDEIKFGDNDALAGIVGSLLNVDLVIILTTVDGIYDKNPEKFKDAKLIEEIDNVDEIISDIEIKGKSEFGTGGMLSKLKAAQSLNYIGIPLVIANGNKKEVIKSIVNDEKVGTRILKKDVKIAAKKRWIFLNLKTKGEIKIDDGAKKALTEKGKSLLAVGVIDVIGNFVFGDAVDIVDKNNEKIGKGITNYSAEALNLIKGKKNTEISKIIKDSYYEEVIHRDNLFIYK